MATAASVQPSETECSVCHENFTTPKILPCAHLLCRHCLVTWLKSETDARCPLCRYAIVDPKDKASKSLDDIADSLPTDLAMEARVECAAILSKDHVCGGCRNSPEKCTCLTCGEMLCTGCTTYHKNFLATRHHKVEDLATMTAERLASSRQLACSVHADKTSELYCPTHGAAICHLCATSKHRACPEVTELEEKMQEARAVLAELAATLKAGESKLEEAISELDQYLVDVEKTTQAVLADIDRKCDRLESSVKKCRQRLKELAKKASTDAKTAANDRKAYLLERRGRMTSHRRLVELTGQSMPRACVADDMPTTLRARVHDLHCDTIVPGGTKPITMATLYIKDEVVGRLEHEISELGILTSAVAAAPLTPPASKLTIWRFHTNHGKSVILSNDQQTAHRVRGKVDAVVISSDPMQYGMLYEVRIDEKSGDFFGSFVCGVFNQDPASLSLPENPRHTAIASLLPAVVIAYGVVWNHGVQVLSNIGKKLSYDSLPVRSRVGLVVDTANSLHLYVDGKHKGVAATGIKQPCYAWFEAGYEHKTLTTLPLKKMI